jgi:hypothetical protein
MPLVLTSGVNSRKTFYVLQPNTVSFVKDEAINRGPATVTIGTKSYSATLVEVIDPQATMKIYVSAKGDLIKAEAPLGMEIIPDSLGAPSVGAGGPMADIAAASSIKPDKPIADPRHLKRFKFELVAPGAPTIPSDGHQTAIKKGDSWNIDVHPVEIDSSNIAIQAAAKAQPLWVTADTYIPSDSAKFKALAKQIVGKETSVKGASLKVQKWVASHMKANLGIGVLRDANEILSSKEGVCRDSAILAATILRAARVPTKLASGLVSWDGTFYYHAWVEVWNGKSWVGIDPTVADRQLSASHVKLAGGNIATAFRFPVLDKVSIKVGEAVPR